MQTLPAELLLFILPPIGRLFDRLLSYEVKVKGSGVKQWRRQTSKHSNKSFAFKHKFLLSRTGLLDFGLLLLWSSLFLLAKTSRCDPPTTLRRFAWCDLLWSSPFSLPDDKSESVPQTRIIYDLLNSTHFLQHSIFYHEATFYS